MFNKLKLEDICINDIVEVKDKDYGVVIQVEHYLFSKYKKDLNSSFNINQELTDEDYKFIYPITVYSYINKMVFAVKLQDITKHMKPNSLRYKIMKFFKHKKEKK